MKKSVAFLNRKVIYPIISIAASLALVFIIVKLNGELNWQLGSKTTADLPVIKEAPAVNPQSNNPGKGDVPSVNRQKPVRKKLVLQQTSINSTAVIKEKNTEITVPENDLKMPDIINKAEMSQKVNLSAEINIPILTENDVFIPRTIQDIESKETKINTTSAKYLSLAEFARKELNEKVLGKKENNHSRVSLFDFAGAGIKGINLLTGSKMKLEKKTNSKGEPDILANVING